MSIEDIEKDRMRLGYSQRAVCRKAGIHPTTYYRLKAFGGGQVSTLEKLAAALLELEKGAA